MKSKRTVIDASCQLPADVQQRNSSLMWCLILSCGLCSPVVRLQSGSGDAITIPMAHAIVLCNLLSSAMDAFFASLTVWLYC